jgi:hypothetical protein
MPHPDGDKHQYIPKFYLKRWAAVDGRVTEYSRPFKKVQPRWVHPDGTGYVRGLYAIHGMSSDEVNLVEEKFLKPADNLGSMTLDDLITGDAFRRPAEMRRDWSRFVFSLLLRLPNVFVPLQRHRRDH